VYRAYLNQVLQIRWRQCLTDRHLREWLTGYAYYQLQFVAGGADNPDQSVGDGCSPVYFQYPQSFHRWHARGDSTRTATGPFNSLPVSSATLDFARALL
jgi:hypothetical protein